MNKPNLNTTVSNNEAQKVKKDDEIEPPKVNFSYQKNDKRPNIKKIVHDEQSGPENILALTDNEIISIDMIAWNSKTYHRPDKEYDKLKIVIENGDELRSQISEISAKKLFAIIQYHSKHQ